MWGRRPKDVRTWVWEAVSLDYPHFTGSSTAEGIIIFWGRQEAPTSGGRTIIILPLYIIYIFMYTYSEGSLPGNEKVYIQYVGTHFIRDWARARSTSTRKNQYKNFAQRQNWSGFTPKPGCCRRVTLTNNPLAHLDLPPHPAGTYSATDIYDELPLSINTVLSVG